MQKILVPLCELVLLLKGFQIKCVNLILKCKRSNEHMERGLPSIVIKQRNNDLDFAITESNEHIKRGLLILVNIWRNSQKLMSIQTLPNKLDYKILIGFYFFSVTKA